MKINKTNNVNFKGYSNIVTGQLSNGRQRISYITAKLNNLGEKDLAKYEEIRSLFPFLEKEKNRDIITISCIETPRERPSISFDRFKVFNSDELHRGIEMDILGKDSENYCAKIYSLIGSLTRRIWNDNNAILSKPINETFAESINNFAYHIESKDKFLILKLFENSFIGNTNANEVAFVINKAVDATFGDYFAR